MGLEYGQSPKPSLRYQKSETPLNVWSLFDRKIPKIEPILQLIFIFRIEMPISSCSHALGGTRGSRDVVLPLELGLGLLHLLLDPVQEEGVHETLRVALHGGQPEVL